jgi:hypothetical protein
MLMLTSGTIRSRATTQLDLSPVATITGGTPQAESRLTRHVAAGTVRLRALRATA